MKTTICDTRDDFCFPIVIFPFVCGNNSAAPAHGINISQLITYTRASIFYHEVPDRGLLLTWKLSNQ